MQQPPVIDRTVYATSSAFADDARDCKVVFCGEVTDMGRRPRKGAHLVGYVCPVGNVEGLVLLANCKRVLRWAIVPEYLWAMGGLSGI
jgi:hypothetical protein